MVGIGQRLAALHFIMSQFEGSASRSKEPALSTLHFIMSQFEG